MITYFINSNTLKIRFYQNNMKHAVKKRKEHRKRSNKVLIIDLFKKMKCKKKTSTKYWSNDKYDWTEQEY